MQPKWNDGMVEYWNVDLNKEVTHLLMRLRRINLPIKSDFANPSPCPRQVHPLFHFPITHYSIIPVFQYSNCERSELSSISLYIDIKGPNIGLKWPFQR